MDLIDREDEQKNRTPGLSRIPIIKYLFKRKGVTRTTDELLFFITPRIIYGFQGSDPEDDFPGGGF